MRRDDIVGQAVGGREGSEPAILEAGEAASVGTDPERILVVFLKRPDFVVFQTSGFDRERPETGSVEADGAAIGAQPDVAVVGLHDGPDPGLRQALRLAPEVDAIAGVPGGNPSPAAHTNGPEGEQNRRRQASGVREASLAGGKG
jgi:hypothetical protein